MCDYVVCNSGGKENRSDKHTLGFNIFRIIEQPTDEKPYFTAVRIGWTKDESTIPGFIDRRETQRAAFTREEACQHTNSTEQELMGPTVPLVG